MGGLFKTPEPPAPPPTPVIPDVDDAAVKRAKRRSLAASRLRSGVASTVRAEAGGGLGGVGLGAKTILGGAFGSYDGKTLGGG